MTTLTRPRRVRSTRAIAAAAALFGAMALAVAGAAAPAIAHDELLGSSPEPGAVLETAPEAVELTFSNDVIEVGTVIEVVDHHGEAIDVGATEVLGPEVSATLPSDLSGEYQVRWRVVSSDGHPIEGTIDFGVGAGATGVWESEPPHDDAAADDDSDTAATTGGESGPDGWAIAAFVVGGIVILGLVIVLIVRTTRRRPPGADAP
ncbi:copper resistance CopC family protein [Agromyces aerolatus]|uniref:copper resistance CopC family protein n=1 Tax=Agromyces sp. LY-1074 TaxID=3074080 RepID=UPI00285B0450|nr:MULTISPECIES: copper resistance protein CopC [unclassified Agromyces]MDR5698667.1 copper resistance protein CopC [Agromyces sp. LY-1074]MDR5704961.1 copper resistance protein CopC [Agromyces sp. LY-1358]